MTIEYDPREGVDHIKRLQAVALVLGGQPARQVATQMGVTAGSVRAWIRSAKTGSHAIPNRSCLPRIEATRIPEIIGLLAPGPRQYGLPADSWTAKTIAELLNTATSIKTTSGTISHWLGRRGIPWHDLPALQALYHQMQTARSDSTQQTAPLGAGT